MASLNVAKDLGLRILLYNSFYKYPFRYKMIWKKLHGIMVLWSVPFLLICSGVIYITIPDAAGNNTSLIILLNCIPILLFDNTSMIGDTLFRLKEKPVPVVSINIVAGLISIACTFTTIVYFKMGYIGWFISSFISSFATFLPYCYYIYIKDNFFPLFNINFQMVKQNLKISLPTIPHNLAGQLLNVGDRIMMENLKVDVNKIGLYNMAYIVGNYFSFFETAAGMAIGPMYMRYYSNKDEINARKLTFLTQFLFLLVTFIACLWIKEIFYVLVKNPELQSAYYLAVIIIMSFNYKPLFIASTNILFYKEKTTDILKISFSSAVMNLILNLIFIPVFGIIASAVITFLCFMFMGVYGFYLKNYRINVKLNYYQGYWLIAIIATTILAYLAKDIQPLFKIVVTSALCLISFILFKKYKHIFPTE